MKKKVLSLLLAVFVAVGAVTAIKQSTVHNSQTASIELNGTGPGTGDPPPIV